MNQIVSVIDLGMVNAFLLMGEHLILVDTGFNNHYDKILTYLESHYIDPKKIKLIVLTHNHGDHVGNLTKLHRLTGADVVIHQDAYEELARGVQSPVVPTTLASKAVFGLFGLLSKSHEIAFEPNRVFSDSFDLEPYGTKGKLIHTPGHTNSSISVILESGDAIVGDMIIGKKKGAESVAKLHHIAENPDIRLNSLSRILDEGVERIYPSHGVMCTAEAVKVLIEKV